MELFTYFKKHINVRRDHLSITSLLPSPHHGNFTQGSCSASRSYWQKQLPGAKVKEAI